jgi:hypothetical protein
MMVAVSRWSLLERGSLAHGLTVQTLQRKLTISLIINEKGARQMLVKLTPEFSSNGTWVERVRLNKVDNLFRPVGQTFRDKTAIRLKKMSNMFKKCNIRLKRVEYFDISSNKTM